MKLKQLTPLSHYFELLKSNYWFIPSLMIASSLVIAFIMLEVDSQGYLPMPEWLSTNTADGARQILVTIAGAAITIAGVTFSITIVTLSLASQQFGPRTLRNFLSDRGNQFTLGTFMATFTYCLTILGSVRGGEGAAYVPEWAVFFALIQALHCVIVLVYFIHNVASSIRGPAIIRQLYSQARKILLEQYPSTKITTDSSVDNDIILPESFAKNAAFIKNTKSGYVQNININQLLHHAEQHDLLIQSLCYAGEFSYYECPIVSAAPAHKVTDELRQQIIDCFLIGSIRTPEQDPTHQPDRITELAVRALSPGINDPFSALECLNWLSDLLIYLARHEIPPSGKKDDQGVTRLWIQILDFGRFMDQVLTPIRQYGKDSALVVERFIKIYTQLLDESQRLQDRQAIQRHLLELQDDIKQQFCPKDQKTLEEKLALAIKRAEQLIAST